jgi:hypothetical protein
MTLPAPIHHLAGTAALRPPSRRGMRDCSTSPVTVDHNERASDQFRVLDTASLPICGYRSSSLRPSCDQLSAPGPVARDMPRPQGAEGCPRPSHPHCGRVFGGYAISARMRLRAHLRYLLGSFNLPLIQATSSTARLTSQLRERSVCSKVKRLDRGVVEANGKCKPVFLLLSSS